MSPSRRQLRRMIRREIARQDRLRAERHLAGVLRSMSQLRRYEEVAAEQAGLVDWVAILEADYAQRMALLDQSQDGA